MQNDFLQTLGQDHVDAFAHISALPDRAKFWCGARFHKREATPLPSPPKLLLSSWHLRSLRQVHQLVYKGRAVRHHNDEARAFHAVWVQQVAQQVRLRDGSWKIQPQWYKQFPKMM